MYSVAFQFVYLVIFQFVWKVSTLNYFQNVIVKELNTFVELNQNNKKALFQGVHTVYNIYTLCKPLIGSVFQNKVFF